MLTPDTANHPSLEISGTENPLAAVVLGNRRNWFVPVALFCLVLLLYSLTPTWGYYGDGITYAFNIEHVFDTGKNYPRLIHQNHLLYSVAGYYAYTLAALVSNKIRSIQVLQVGSMLLGALGVVAFYDLALSYLRTTSGALICAAALAVLAGWWRTSTDADAYIVGAALVVCSAAIARRSPNLWHVAALVLTLATLAHQLAALSVFAIAYVVYSTTAGTRWHRLIRSISFSVLAGGSTAIAYLAVALGAHRASGGMGVLKWAVSNQGGFQLALDPVGNLGPAFLSNVRLVFAHDLTLFTVTATSADFVVLGLSAISLVVGVTLGVRLLKTCHRLEWNRIPSGVLTTCLLWIAPFALFLLVWEPYLTYYRVFYAPAVVLMIGAALNAVALGGHRWQRLLVAWSLVVGLLLANLALYIRPNMDMRANPLIFQAKTLLPSWGGGGDLTHRPKRGRYDGALLQSPNAMEICS